MINFKNKKITVIGAKRSGQAAAKLALDLGADVFVSDNVTEADWICEFQEWAKTNNVKFEFGGHGREVIEESDLIVLSPGVLKDSVVVKWAKEKKIPVISEIELAYQACPCPIVAVTGSNGKTTVSTLIRNVIEKSGRTACLCGNVGSAFSKYVLGLKKDDYVVLEVSSFQLETIDSFKPKIAVFLNFSQNHLDRHKDLDEYFDAKKRLFCNQDENDYVVLNALDQKVNRCAQGIKAQVFYFNIEQDLSNNKLNNPNFLAVRKVAEILRINQEVVRRVFKDFSGLEHRMERVRVLEGVDFINDSKATTAEAARWALENIERPVVWICGGKDKNIDFSVLSELVGRKVKKIFAIGEAKGKVEKTFGRIVDVEKCSSLKEVVEKSFLFSQAGDCILLSPMCASFDMFADFEDRGRKFKDIVNGLGSKS